MGLKFSHCDARWSYSGFGRFRRRLANEIGMDLDRVEGFNGFIPFSSYEDDILPLLNHSDCDGELTVEECRKVAPRLRKLVSSWEDGDYDKRKAIELANGMDYAVEYNEPLGFFRSYSNNSLTIKNGFTRRVVKQLWKNCLK